MLQPTNRSAKSISTLGVVLTGLSSCITETTEGKSGNKKKQPRARKRDRLGLIIQRASSRNSVCTVLSEWYKPSQGDPRAKIAAPPRKKKKTTFPFFGCKRHDKAETFGRTSHMVCMAKKPQNSIQEPNSKLNVEFLS